MMVFFSRPNVCIERSEENDDEEKSDEDKTEFEKNETTTEKIPNFFQTAISLSNCKQGANKYECVTK